MRLLLDTHFLIWVTAAPEKLKAAERALLDQANDVLVSSISLLEIRVKWRARQQRGKGEDVLSPAVALELIRRNRLALAELGSDDIAAVLGVPVAHGDPFDELLVLHAQQLGACLLTRDAALRNHPLAYRFA